MMINSNERLDDLGIKGYKIIQNPDLFCFGIDAVLLSEFVRIRPGQRVMDLCTGNGIIPILLAAKTRAESIVGMEIQEKSADLAKRSIEYNKLNDRIDIVTKDIKNASKIFGKGVFDAVTCNPPYMIGEHGLTNTEDSKAVARHEILCTFEDIARESSILLKEGGNFFMVHRPFRIVELFAILTKYKIEPKVIRFVHPYIDKEPNMLLLYGKKGAKSRVTIEKPLIVYKSAGVYTDEVKRIYVTNSKAEDGE